MLVFPAQRQDQLISSNLRYNKNTSGIWSKLSTSNSECKINILFAVTQINLGCHSECPHNFSIFCPFELLITCSDEEMLPLGVPFPKNEDRFLIEEGRLLSREILNCVSAVESLRTVDVGLFMVATTDERQNVMGAGVG